MRDETIQEAGAVVASHAEREQNWIKDGSATTEPETVETPEQPRDPATGQFLAKTEGAPSPSATHSSPAAEPSASAVPAAPPAPPAAGATAQEVIDYIEAQHGETVFKIPRGVKLPLKRGEQVEYATIDEIQKRGMLEFDYRQKTADVARIRRDAEAVATRAAAAEARTKAREQFLAEREQQMIEAQKDPEKWDAYLELQRQYQTNPNFRKVMDDALAKRESDAELEVYHSERHEREVNDGVELARSWIDEIGRDFAGVDPERVRAIYAQALTTGQAQLDPGQVRAIYETEARYLTESQSPLQKQLADLQARLDAVEGAKAAEKHNAKTSHALDRAKTPPVAASGRPPAPATAPKAGRFGVNDLPERNAAWAAHRD